LTERPRRYPDDPRLSSIVDQIQAIEDELKAAGDGPNVKRLYVARQRVLDVARGIR
jgi:hypothetical protein